MSQRCLQSGAKGKARNSKKRERRVLERGKGGKAARKISL